MRVKLHHLAKHIYVPGVSLADKQAVVLGTTGNIMLTSTPIAAYFKREGAVATVYDLPDGQSVAGLESVVRVIFSCLFKTIIYISLGVRVSKSGVCLSNRPCVMSTIK